MKLLVFRTHITCPLCLRRFLVYVYPGFTHDRICPACKEVLEVEEPPLEEKA